MTLVIAALVLSAIAADPPRLTRPEIRNDKGELRRDATIGQNAVDYYTELQTEHPGSLPVLNEAFACKLGPTMDVKPVARKRARALPSDVKFKLAANDQAALESLAIDVIGDLDGVDPVKIRADETIGPGVYRPAITAVAYTIARCRFYR
jgi:hypothetical protein